MYDSADIAPTGCLRPVLLTSGRQPQRMLAKQLPDQVEAPPLTPNKDAYPEEVTAWEQVRKKQSSKLHTKS
jgi:hypothetical protein